MRVLLIVKRRNGKEWQETGRQVRNRGAFQSLLDRQGYTEGPYLKMTWCSEQQVKIQDELLYGKWVRFIWIWQENQELIPARYWDGAAE